MDRHLQGSCCDRQDAEGGARWRANSRRRNIWPITNVPAGSCAFGGSWQPVYGSDESRADYDARRIYTPVRWQSKPDLSELCGKTMKLHFEIKGAALYAYRLVPQPAR